MLIIFLVIHHFRAFVFQRNELHGVNVNVVTRACICIYVFLAFVCVFRFGSYRIVSFPGVSPLVDVSLLGFDSPSQV